MGTLDLKWLTASSGSGVRGLSLLSSLLGALKELRGAAAVSVGWNEALSQLVAALGSGTRPAAIAPADWDALVKDWAALEDALKDKLPQALRPLTLQLSDLAKAAVGDSSTPGLLEYPLLMSDRPLAGADVIGGLTFDTSADLQGKASVAIQAYAATPDWASDIGYQAPHAELLVRIGVHGQLIASAAATATPAWGSVSISGSAQGAASLDYCFDYPSSRYVAQVLLDSLPQMPAPADLSGLLTTCQGDDFAMSIVDVSGGLKIGGSLGIGTALVGKIGTGLADWAAVTLTQPPTVTANLAATVAFHWGLDGDYRTLVRRVGRSASVRIDRLTQRSTGASLDISATLDVDGLQAMLDPVMAKVMPSAEPLISRLGELADLRGLARDTLQKRLGLAGSGTWPSIARQLIAVATGGDASAASAGHADELSQTFDDLAKTYLGDKSKDLGPFVQKLVSWMQAEPTRGAAVTPAPAAPWADAIAAIKDRIDKAYAGFAASVNDVAGTITQALAGPGASVGAFIGDLQKRSTAATGPLLEWLDAYEAARKKIASAVAQVEQEKLAVTWAATYQKQRADSVLVEVLVAAATPSSKALYAALRTGRLDDYDSLMAACEAEGSASEVQCLFRATQTRKTQYAFTLNVSNAASVAATTSLMDSIVVDADRTGRIIAAGDTVTLDQQLAVRSKLTDASLTIDLEMLAVPGALPSLSTLYSASGDNFSAKDRDDFFGLLERANAVSAGTDDRVRDLLWAGSTSSDATLSSAELSVLYVPDAAAWERLLGCDAKAVELAIRQRCMQLLGMAIDLGAERGLSDGTPAAWVAGWLQQTNLSEADFWALAVNRRWSDWFNKLVDTAELGVAHAEGLAKGDAQRSLKQLWAIQRISSGAGAAWVRVADAHALLVALRSGSPALSREEALSRLADISDGITNGFKTAFASAIPDLEQATKVSWQYLGPILALASLASAGNDPPMITKVKAQVRGQAVAQLIV
jgi:hypothetical protein